MIDYCPDCGHRYTEGHFNRCPASGLTTESTDSDPKPHVHKVIESMPWWARVFEQHAKGDDQ